MDLRTLISILICVTSLSAAPQRSPCEGEDCLHKLMHGDDKPHDEHIKEDMMEKIKDEMAQGANKEKVGPDPNSINFGEEQSPKAVMAPEERHDQKPMDAMESLHGVLMHGDDEKGHDHSKDDKKLTQKAKEDGSEDGPKDIMDEMHGILMHGDSEVGHDHGKEHDEMKKDDEAADKLNRPQDLMEELHGVLMHADGDMGEDHAKEHEEDRLKKDEAGKAAGKVSAPKDAMENLHGVLMHADDETGSDHDHEDDKLRVEDPLKPSVVQMPDNLGFGEAPKEQKDDFEKWKQEQEAAKAAKVEPDGKVHHDRVDGKEDTPPPAFSFRDISDSILDEVQQLKTRYLSKLFGSEKPDEEQQFAEELQKMKGKKPGFDGESLVHGSRSDDTLRFEGEEVDGTTSRNPRDPRLRRNNDEM